MNNIKIIATQTLSRFADAIRKKDPDLGNPYITPLDMPKYISFLNAHGFSFGNGEGGVAYNFGTNLRAKFQNNTLRMYPVISDQVEDMQQAFNNCRNLVGTPMCGDSVVYAAQMYRDCWNLTGEPQCGGSVIHFDLAYYNCVNITGNAIIGGGVKNAPQAYYNCSNLDGFIEAPAYYTNNHPHFAVNLRQTFYDCRNLKGQPIPATPWPWPGPTSDITTDMYQAYYNCHCLTGNAVIDNVTVDMTSMYQNCYNLDGRGCCGPNVTTMTNTFHDCHNLTGPAIIGNKVATAYNVYRNCHYIYDAVIPNSVTRIDNGFRDCWNLGRTYMSPAVQVFIGIYNNCQNLTGSVIAGKEIQWVQDCFYNCFKLQGVYIIGNDNTASSIMNVTRSVNGFNRTAIDDPSKLSRLNVVFSRRATMQKLAAASVTGCAMTAVTGLAADNKTVSLPITYANGQVYGYKNYTCAAFQCNEMYNLYFYSLN